jgi:hypothetical protein
MSVTSAYSDLCLDVTRAPLRSADPDLGGSGLNWQECAAGFGRPRGAVCDSARHPLLDAQRPRIPAQPSCNVRGPSRANGGSSPVGTNGRHPAVCQVLFGPLRSALLLLGVGQLLDLVRLRTLGVGFGAPCLSIVEL